MSQEHEAQWASHPLRGVDPAMIVEALTTERGIPIVSALIDAIGGDLNALASLAAAGIPIDADLLERLVARCRLAAAMAAKQEAQSP